VLAFRHLQHIDIAAPRNNFLKKIEFENLESRCKEKQKNNFVEKNTSYTFSNYNKPQT